MDLLGSCWDPAGILWTGSGRSPAPTQQGEPAAPGAGSRKPTVYSGSTGKTGPRLEEQVEVRQEVRVFSWFGFLHIPTRTDQDPAADAFSPATERVAARLWGSVREQTVANLHECDQRSSGGTEEEN